MSEETKKKLSEARKGKNNPFYGRHLSEEAKEKLRRERLIFMTEIFKTGNISVVLVIWNLMEE